MTKMHYKPARKVHADVIFFTVTIADDGAIVVQKIPDVHEDSSEDKESLFMLHFSPEHAIALHLFWVNGKPAPESPLRRAGLMAVIRYIHSIVPPDVQKYLEGQFGIGHAYSAKAEWDKPE
jgi:hypothetical protein